MLKGLIEPIREEFEGADFGDERLSNRLLGMAEVLENSPTKSLAGAARTVAAREASYRFVENRRVTMEGILAPHIAATAGRCREAGLVYVLSDTTEFTFAGESRAGSLGRIQGKRRGFLAHVALAVSADGGRRPLGVLGIDPWIRADKRVSKHRNDRQEEGDSERESLRWGQLARRAEEALGGTSAIHVMDREADIFELLSELRKDGKRFVIRGSRDRLLTENEKLFESMKDLPTLLEREVDLTARRKPRQTTKGRGHPLRRARQAKLNVCSRRVALRRPKRCQSELPQSLEVNVVHIYEAEAPPDETPIDWLLITSEPIESMDDVGAVVDAYRARWLIEEYFKAIKSGCAYESRQLRKLHTLQNMLGIVAVIAWRLLLLRALERKRPNTPACEVIDPALIEALGARLKDIREPQPLPVKATVADIMKAIARLGGHHKSNGDPGWQLLWSGFQDWLFYAAGYLRGKSATSCDHS